MNEHILRKCLFKYFTIIAWGPIICGGFNTLLAGWHFDLLLGLGFFLLVSCFVCSGVVVFVGETRMPCVFNFVFVFVCVGHYTLWSFQLLTPCSVFVCVCVLIFISVVINMRVNLFSEYLVITKLKRHWFN